MVRRLLQWLSRRRPWPGSLRGRLIALLLATLAIAQGAALFFFFDERNLAVRAVLAEETVARTASMVLLLQRVGPDERADVLFAASTRLSRYDVSDRPIAERGARGFGARRLRRVLITTLHSMSSERWVRRVRVEVQRRMRRSDSPRRAGGRPRPPIVLAISIDLGQGSWLNVESRFRQPPLQWAGYSLVSLALAGVGVIVVVWLTVGRLTRPLRMLADAAERFGRGARNAPVEETGPVEARRLIATFNAMQERLTRFVSDRTRLLASISHDLRTPLTAMRIRAELIENEEMRAKMIDGLEDMQSMVEATLAFAKQDAEEEPTRLVDLGALVGSVVEDFIDLGANVVFEPVERYVLECRPEGMKRAIRNLIENAIRYGESASVSMQVAADEVAIRIDDRGPGVPADQIEQLFEPFARAERSRSRDTGGVGLGLSIARSIARAHGGDVTLRNRRGGGLRAELTAPIKA